MRNTRTFTDLDLNFRPAPSSQDRIIGEGTITVMNNTPIVIGVGTRFNTLLNINDNIYIKNSFIGKVKSIQSDTQLTLYENGKVTRSVYIHDVGDEQYIHAPTEEILASSPEYEFSLVATSENVTEGNLLQFILNSPAAPVGLRVPYTVYNISRDDLDLSNPDCADITGYFNFYAPGKATLNFYLAADNLNEILEIMFLELSGYVYIIPSTPFTYSTPGDITLRYDESAVKASIKHIVSTMNFERPFNSKLGSMSRAIFFENVTPMTYILLKKTVQNAISNFEPRVEVLDVSVQIDGLQHEAIITIVFRIINTMEPLQVAVILDRTR